MELTVDRRYLNQTLIDLIRINSINPSLVAGGPGEAEIAAYIVNALRSLTLEVTTHEPEPGRVSVVGIVRGTDGGRSLMLNAHVDTVGIEGMPEPFSAVIRDGRIYGRGAYDMKGSLAACLTAVKALVDGKVRLRGDLVVAAAADEEYASMRRLCVKLPRRFWVENQESSARAIGWTLPCCRVLPYHLEKRTQGNGQPLWAGQLSGIPLATDRCRGAHLCAGGQVVPDRGTQGGGGLRLSGATVGDRTVRPHSAKGSLALNR